MFLEEGGLEWYTQGDTRRAGLGLSVGNSCEEEPHVAIGMDGGDDFKVLENRVHANGFQVGRASQSTALPLCEPTLYGTMMADTRPGAASGSLVVCIEGVWEGYVKESVVADILARLAAVEAQLA